MSDRTALLIYCSQDELAKIRGRAAFEHRTVSGYVLNIVMRAVAFEESLFVGMKPVRGINRAIATQAACSPGPKTTMLLRCSLEEAQRIRSAAKGRESTISAFVRQSLKRSWSIADGIVVPGGSGEAPGVPAPRWNYGFTESAGSDSYPRRPQ